LRSPISIPLRFTAEGGGSFRATPWQLHSNDKFLLRAASSRRNIRFPLDPSTTCIVHSFK
jgi:hypothetical protein